MKELVARIKIILKRNANLEDTNLLEYGDLQLDLESGKMICDSNEILINGKELNLLEILLINKSQVINRETLADKI